jgi:hypothetical protein
LPILSDRIRLNAMLRFLSLLLRWIVGRPKSLRHGLTAIEYEAVSLIAYEGREAYARAREQADYCRSVASPSGVVFWLDVAAEVDRRTGAGAGRAKERPR